MWDCLQCGCRAIAASLLRCPNTKCREERDVPRTTVEGGPSNAAAGPGEPGYSEPDAEPEGDAAEVAAPEPVAAAAGAKAAPAPAAAPPKDTKPATGRSEPSAS